VVFPFLAPPSPFRSRHHSAINHVTGAHPDPPDEKVSIQHTAMARFRPIVLLAIPLGLLFYLLFSHFNAPIHKFPSPALCVDAIIHTRSSVLLIKRGGTPFKGFWALPGGFVNLGENPNDAVVREVEEETGIDLRSLKNNLKLVTVDGRPGIDVRGHAVTVVYSIAVPQKVDAFAGDDAANIQWFDFDQVPETLAFAHADFLAQFHKASFSLGTASL